MVRQCQYDLKAHLSHIITSNYDACLPRNVTLRCAVLKVLTRVICFPGDNQNAGNDRSLNCSVCNKKVIICLRCAS